LLSNTTYYFRVKASNQDNIETGYTDLGSTVTASVHVCEPLPSPLSESVLTTVSIHGFEKTSEFTRGVMPNETPSIFFSLDVDTSSVNSGIILKAIKNNYAEKISEIVTGTFNYDKTQKKLTFIPALPLKKGYSYEFTLNKPRNPVSVNFETIFDHTVENKIDDLQTKASLALKSNSFGSDGYVSFSKSKTESFTEGQVINVAEIKAYDEKNSEQNPTQTAHLTLSFSYPDENADGIVDNTEPKVQINSLAIYHYSLKTERWERLYTEVNSVSKTASAPVTTLSKFLIVGLQNDDAGKAYAYPVPFEPGKGHFEIKFGRNPDAPLPGKCQIRIYSISGDLLKELIESDGDGTLSWNPVTDSNDTELKSGTYIYVIETKTNKKTGKIMVIR
ncbi:MAG: T9SS type A sorting domain-containing protein, partial [Elusimicrobiota bacterium]